MKTRYSGGGFFHTPTKASRRRQERFVVLRKLPADGRTFSRVAKVSCAVQDVFARRESFLRCAGRFRTPRKFPALCRTFSRIAKVSCAVQGVFARRESFLRCAGRFRASRKLQTVEKGSYSNRILFAGSMRMMRYEGPRSISMEAASVPIFKSMSDVRLRSIGTASR